MPLRHNVSSEYPSLRKLGLAASYHPNVVNKTYQPHTVDVLLMSFIMRGKGWHMMGEERHREAGASLGVTMFGQEHDILTDSKGMDIYNVYLVPERHRFPRLPDELEAVLSTLLPLHAGLSHRMNRRVRVPLPSPTRIEPLLAIMVRELQEQSRAYEAAVQSAWRLILIEICRAALETDILPEMPRTESQRRLEAARQQLDEHYHEPQELDALARRAGLSTSHFCRAFRDYTGKPPIQYLIERRLQRAMHALINSDKTVLEIALACGFNDLSHFNRKFKALVGKSPRQYRKQPALLGGVEGSPTTPA